MKTKFVLASFIAALAGLGFASTAKAGTDFRINLNLSLPRPPVVVVPAGSVYSVPAYGYGRVETCPPAPRGYWSDVTVKTWVPARWVVTCDRRGREIRTLAPGYFTYHTDRVWVDYARDYDHGYGHDGSYGYANNSGYYAHR